MASSGAEHDAVVSGKTEDRSRSESTRTVLVALGADLGVALSKAGAAALTGSPALAAEASHSLADTANGLFLLVAQRRIARPSDDRHPLGHGREVYFWALIAAFAAFVAGAAFSLRDGIIELVHPSVTSSFAVGYVVLGISSVFDLVSFRRSAGQLIGRGRRYSRSLLEESRATSDPTLRTVFVEDAVSLSGDLIAFAGLGLSQLTGASSPQGVAAVLIGLLLIRISLRLVRRSHDFLIGVWVLVPAPQDGARDELTQPIRPTEAEAIRSMICAHPGVTDIRELFITFIGPGRIWVVARVGIAGDLSGAQVESLAQGLEANMRQQSDTIYRVDVVPAGSIKDAELE